MKKNLKILSLIVLVGSTSACSYVFGQTVNLTVEDQKGKPVPEAQVTMAFLRRYDGDRKDGISNDEGVVKMRGSGDLGIDTIVTKPGYYKSEKRITGEGSINTSILLRKKKKPVPMYVKEVSARFPDKGKKFGFDFKEADWVAPYGNGSEAHVYFKLNGYKRSNHDLKAHLVVTFPNPKSGIMKVSDVGGGSVFKFPYDAPIKGYHQKVEHRYNYSPRENKYPKRESTREYLPFGYIFKIVDKASADKKEANFGKILGEFGFAVGMSDSDGFVGRITFTYYYNPESGERSLEFDPQRNLFKDPENTYPP